MMVLGALSEALNWYSSSKIASLIFRKLSRNQLRELTGLSGNTDLVADKRIQFNPLEFLFAM